ncbi:glycosyltransferase family 52 [Pseudoalteromonas rubra]|uniref:CMP-N-acetylneuraminate-beta-galactosamide-alpha-2, 3-sialyltransferase n=1 Tax=Pseudoalteromonas rubra TaxID=43658 RepID=A0A0U3HPR0_9GAMM|nr:glycosyltransferase family 52 [Pseudoalteromonas rubra]ALU43241.1 hypothetical protein AT705_09980 [Pseudoalteromonas rubra]
MKNQLVCYTTLQLMIAERVVAKLGLSDVVFSFVTKKPYDSSTNFIGTLRDRGYSVNEYYYDGKVLETVFELVRVFSKVRADSIYIASIDNVFMHLILSKASYDSLYTFDDGSANVIKSSVYYNLEKRSYKFKLFYFLFFINFDASKVKRLSKAHYTIYPNRSNIIEKTVPVTLFDYKSEGMKNGKSINVLVGACYNEIFVEDCSTLIDNVCAFLDDTGLETVYVKHPREFSSKVANKFKMLDSRQVAEVHISNLLDEYETVNIYSFLSTCQLNLSSIPRVNNFVIYSEKMTSTFKSCIKEFSDEGFFTTLELD